MEKKNKIILAAIVVVAVVAIIIAAMVSSKPAEDSAIVDNNKTTQTATQTATEAPKVTPTFVYFVSQNDAAYATAMATVEKLQTEYEGQINFDIRDVDSDPTTAENFAFVMGQTPALIMLNTSNDICAIELANPGEDALRAAITKALGE